MVMEHGWLLLCRVDGNIIVEVGVVHASDLRALR